MFLGAKKEWRDIKVEVGLMLHGWLVAKLREVDHLFVDRRRQMGVTVKSLIPLAAKRLEVNARQITSLIRLANTARLLAEADERGLPVLGDLPYTMLHRFSHFIGKLEGRPREGGTKLLRQDARMSASEKEDSWRVLPPADQRVTFFRTVIAERWAWDEIVSALKTRKFLAGDPTESRINVRESDAPPLRSPCRAHQASPSSSQEKLHDRGGPSVMGNDVLLSLKKASTRDAAELLHDLIHELPDPATLVRLLVEMEAAGRKPTGRKRISLSEDG